MHLVINTISSNIICQWIFPVGYFTDGASHVAVDIDRNQGFTMWWKDYCIWLWRMFRLMRGIALVASFTSGAQDGLSND